jgi:hypothetical protein
MNFDSICHDSAPWFQTVLSYAEQEKALLILKAKREREGKKWEDPLDLNLFSLKEKIDNFINQGIFNSQLEQLLTNDHFNCEEWNFIFLFNQYLIQFEKDFSTHSPFYQPLVENTQKLKKKAWACVKKDYRYHSKAALRAEIFSKAINETRAIIEKEKKLDKDQESTVYLTSELVYKQGYLRSQEEEKRIADLSELFSDGEGFFSTYFIKEFHFDQLEIPILEEKKRMGYEIINATHPNSPHKFSLNLKSLSSSFQEFASSQEQKKPFRTLILSSDGQKKLLNNLLKRLSKDEQKLVQDIQWMANLEDSTWIISEHKQKKIVPFKELKEKYNKNLLNRCFLQRTDSDQSYPIEKYLTNALFYQSLTGVPPLNIWIIPTELNEESYQKWEKTYYSFNLNGILYKGNFKDLQNLILLYPYKGRKKDFLDSLNLKLLDSHYHPLSFQPGPFEIVDFILQMKWKLMFSDLVNTQNQKITNVRIKPFISEMITISRLRYNPPFQNYALNALSSQAEAELILAGLLQLLDLHEENLALKLESEQTLESYYKNFKKYSSLQFSYQNIHAEKKAHTSLEELHKDYRNGHINDHTAITYGDSSQPSPDSSSELKELGDLKSFLETKWKFIFFDTNYCLGEDNESQQCVITNTGKSKTHISLPFRSCLSENQWAHHPLRKETLDLVKQLLEKQEIVKKWINREDAPLRQRLSKKANERINEMLNIFGQDLQFSLSKIRQQSTFLTLEDVRNQFASDLKDKKDEKIWSFLEEELSQVKIAKQGETWESLSIKHKQNLKDLQFLNSDHPLTPGSKLKIKIDLTSNSEQAQESRKKMAFALFPRLTWRQQEALIQRMNHLRKYLEFYEEAKSPLSPSNKKIDEDFLEVAPLGMEEKEIYYSKLNQGESLHSLIDSCQPTYFNLMCVFYPLLKDVYWIREYAKKQLGPQLKIPEEIGSYTENLIDTIQAVKNHTQEKMVKIQKEAEQKNNEAQHKDDYQQDPFYKENQHYFNLSNKLIEKLNSKKNHNFFGSFILP